MRQKTESSVERAGFHPGAVDGSFRRNLAVRACSGDGQESTQLSQ
jgi:hypothetical protein